MNQNERILNHLKQFGTITPREADRNYGVMRLGARIMDLKKMGHMIVTEKERTINRYGEKVCYARYRLMNERMDEACSKHFSAAD